MRPLSELKADLEVSRGLGDIVDVLKSAALIQLRAFQKKDKPDGEYFLEVQTQLDLVCAKKIPNPCLFDRKSLPSVIIAVTSDEGFLGELNTLLINAALDLRRSAMDEIIVLGERGARYLEDVNAGFSFYPGIADEINYKDVCGIRDHLLDGYHKKFGRVFVVYPKFVSLSVQSVTSFQLLPYLPAEGRRAQDVALDGIALEPTAGRALEMLIRLWARFTLLETFWSAKQAELAARIMRLEQSTHELGSLNQKFAFEYFRQVHALKDKVIREISSAKVMIDLRNKMEEQLKS